MVYSRYRKIVNKLSIKKDFILQMAKQSLEDEETKQTFEDIATDDVYIHMVKFYAVLRVVFMTLFIYGMIFLFVLLFFPILTLSTKILAALLIFLIIDVITEIMNLLMRRQ